MTGLGMAVFDDEMGPLCPQAEAKELAVLLRAGLTQEELEAWHNTVAKWGVD